jgi:hypothetical protein
MADRFAREALATPRSNAATLASCSSTGSVERWSSNTDVILSTDSLKLGFLALFRFFFTFGKALFNIDSCSFANANQYILFGMVSRRKIGLPDG